MPKPFDFDHPYVLINRGDGVFMLNAHGVTVASYSVESWGNEQACIEAAWAHAYVTVEGLRGAVARAWCAPENGAKEMDPDLAEAVVAEVYALLQAAP